MSLLCTLSSRLQTPGKWAVHSNVTTAKVLVFRVSQAESQLSSWTNFAGQLPLKRFLGAKFCSTVRVGAFECVFRVNRHDRLSVPSCHVDRAVPKPVFFHARCLLKTLEESRKMQRKQETRWYSRMMHRSDSWLSFLLPFGVGGKSEILTFSLFAFWCAGYFRANSNTSRLGTCSLCMHTLTKFCCHPVLQASSERKLPVWV